MSSLSSMYLMAKKRFLYSDNKCCPYASGNVLKEICYPAGAVIQASAFELGDPTLSVLEIWGAEYQESNALLVHASDRSLLKQIAAREKCPVSFVGQITNDGKVQYCVVFIL